MANTVVWFDIPTLDFDRAVKFYSDIMGTPVSIDESMGMKMGLFPMEDEGNGGAIIPPSDDAKPGNSGTRIYLNCEGQLDAVIGRVPQAGGEVIAPKVPLGQEMGFIAYIKDTEGNVLGLHSSS